MRGGKCAELPLGNRIGKNVEMQRTTRGRYMGRGMKNDWNGDKEKSSWVLQAPSTYLHVRKF